MVIILYYRAFDGGFNRALDFFKSFTFDGNTSIEYVYQMFVNTQNIYTTFLRDSIDKSIKAGVLPNYGNPVFYNYIILDGSKLYNILDRYNNQVVAPSKIPNTDVDEFEECCIYAGKGKSDRNFQHAIDSKKVLVGEMVLKKICEKFEKINYIWKLNQGIVIIQFFTDTTHYEAHAREFAIIKSLKLNNITNVVNGTPYGAMKYWNENEVNNYGKMILYNALKMCIIEPPRVILEEDVILPKKKSRNHDWELTGILQCFLEL